MPLVDQFLSDEPDQEDHRCAEHNEWDINTNFRSLSIWLFASATDRLHNVEEYPNMVPRSKDFGTVNLRVTHQRRKYKIKLYPLLVHVSKSFNIRLQGSIPSTLSGPRTQSSAALAMDHSLNGRSDYDLGGFRIEVTVKTPILAAADRLVAQTPFHSPDYRLGLGDGPYAHHCLSAKTAAKEGLLAYANWVYRHDSAWLFIGRAADKPTPKQLKAVDDVLKAPSWNAGLRRPTKSLSPGAWCW